jgi:hypothetical protein
MTDDDWQPLPSDDLCARPGESCDLVKKAPPPKTPPAPVPPPPPPAAPAPPDPAAERALAELKQKLAAAAPATSLIATVQHREQRAVRKSKAPPAACAATVVRTTTPGDVLLAEVASAEVAKKEDPPDPRENERWFRTLPETERERLRARWWLAQHRHDGHGLVLRLRLQRALLYGALCFLVLSVLQSMLLGGFAYVPIFVAAGALAAGIAEICKGGRFAYAVAGAAAFVAVMGPGLVAQPLSMVSLMIAAYGMGTIGMDGEMRRSGGFSEK